MRARFVIGVAGMAGITLVLAAMCAVVAQSPGTISRPARAAPPPAQAQRRAVPAESTIQFPRAVTATDDPGPVAPAFADSSGSLYTGPATAPAPTKPAVIELRSGLKLDGQLAAGTIPCQVMFGEAALPLGTIRGIRLSDEVTSDAGGQARPTSATIVLENGDSLTGMPRLDVIRLQTDWGEAVVKLAHLQSLVLTKESVTWQQHESRWRLIPAVLPPSEAAEDSTEATRSGPASPAATEAPLPANLLDAPPNEPPSPARAPIRTAPALPERETPATIPDSKS